MIFSVADGTYNERVRITEIDGASASNPITFQSASDDSAAVTLTYATSDAYKGTLILDSTDYITIRKITVQSTGTEYPWVLRINETATNITIENCQFLGYNTTSYSNEYAVIRCHNYYTENIIINNNYVSNGSYGIHFDGTSTLSPGLQITGNTFTGQSEYGIFCKEFDEPVIRNNVIHMNNIGRGIYCEYCDNEMEISGNRVNVEPGYYGIAMYRCDGGSGPGQQGNVFNNYITLQGGSTSSGINLYDCTYQNIYHNSVYLTSSATGTRGALYVEGTSGNLNVKNNIFANLGAGYAFYVSDPSDITESDYNDIYSTGNYVGYWNGSKEELADLQSASGMDANSVSFDPVFASATDLQPGSFRIDDLGTDVGVTTDIDGETRTAPDIGALEFTATGTPFSGTYTIGGTSPHFATFSEAVDSLNEVGISASVIFNVRDGAYTEQITIFPVAGADAGNTVTFQSESGDQSAVEISHASGSENNYVVKLQGADYVTFKNMTLSATDPSYSVVYQLKGNASYDSLLNCVINADNTGTTYYAAIHSYGQNISHVVIANNLISGGYNGITINSDNIANLPGIEITGNDISNQKGSYPEGIYLRYLDAPVVSNNTIENTAVQDDYYGIYLRNCPNDLVVAGNRIISNNENGGIKLYDCVGTTTKKGLVANNFIMIGGSYYALGIHIDNCDYQNIYHNSVRISSTHNSYGRAFYNEGTSQNLVLKNNIFSNFGGGYAFYVSDPSDITESDYNDFYSTGNFIIFWDGSNYYDFEDYQLVASPKDANSVSANPSFTSSTDLHTSSSFLDNAATPVGSVTVDIDGESRDGTTPDIGADEFATATAPIAGGTYTIGGTSPDYATFTDAVDDLNNLGIAGPVVFNVRDDSYEEQITILDVNGADETNTITFQSESGDSSAVELTYSANANYKYVVALRGTDYITFRQMTFSATSTSYSVVFFMKGGLQGVTIENCVINGNGVSGYEYDQSVFYSSDAIMTGLTIRNNSISGGRSGIWLNCDQNNYATGTLVKNNTFSGQYYNAVYLDHHDAPAIENNHITNSSGSGYFYGIRLHHCSNGLLVSGNDISSTGSRGGIYLYYCNGTISKKGLVKNNFAQIGGGSYAYGILTERSDYQRIYNNSVRITSTDADDGLAFYDYSSTEIDVRNNIFANMGGGYAYYVNRATDIVASDYNDLFTTGNYLARWNGNRTTLAELQAESGMDANSLSVNPVFVSESDMHTTSSYLDSAGTVLAEVTVDIDGETRHANKPDIGADEFTATTFPLAGNYTIGGTSPDYTTFSDAVDDLIMLGIEGPVTFNVRPGTYTEQFELFDIAGASGSDTIVFQSESGDSTGVILTHDAVSSSENYIIKMSGTDYITFRNMTLAATDATWGRVIHFNGSTNNINILNNVISTDNDASSSVILSPNGNLTNNILIKNNLISEGGTAIKMDGNDTDHSEGVRIIGNTLRDQSDYGIYLLDQDAPEVTGNVIEVHEYGFIGIYFYDCDGEIVIRGNKFTNNNNSTGIRLDYCNGTLVSQGLIANNFAAITGSSYAYGIYFLHSEYQNIYYNTVNIASTYYSNTGKEALYINGGDYINIKNNIFANTKGGYAYYINSADAVESSDYNNLYSTTDVAYWGGAKSTLSDLQTASSMDEHSRSLDPRFNAETDYRILQAGMHQAATPLTEVTVDIAGRDRDPVNPDIGAMEFYCETPDFDVEVLPTCFGDSTVFIDHSTNIALGSTYNWDFDGDFNPDSVTTGMPETMKHRFETTGEHTVNYIVQQIAGCNDYVEITVDILPLPEVTLHTEGAYCGNDDGRAWISTADEDMPLTYNWSTGSTDTISQDLAIGTYTVAVADTNNCISNIEVEIGDAMQVTVTELSPSTCGLWDGEAVATITGGVSPYEYVWSNGETADTNKYLAPGLHYVNVIDVNGCYAQGSINMSNDGTGPQIELFKQVNNACYGDTSGSVNITVTGGGQPYDIQWSNGATTEDISGLAAGVYDMVVMDADSCMASASYKITQPPKLNVSAVVENASCAGSDGRAVAVVSGGTEPYLYSWSTGGKNQIEENLSADIYSVTVTDANGCKAVKPVIVNNIGGPVVSVESVTGVSCSDTTNGAIDIGVSGGTPLYSYLWSNGETTQDISGLTPGTYKVTVTDDVGCIGVNNAEIKQEPPAVNPICLVTVDTVTGANLIAWERNADITDVSHYNIYRESSQKGLFQLIGSRPVDSITYFIDSVADPTIRSWRYKISVMDACGNESELSEAHKTMHLTMNLGLLNSVNLIWDHYEGFNVSTYKIWRYSAEYGWEKIHELSSDNTSYTDHDPPGEGLYYYIEVDHPTGCTLDNLKASFLNASRSNRTSTDRARATDVQDLLEKQYGLRVYPNPSSGIFHLSLNLPGSEDMDVKVFNMQGKLLFNRQYKNISHRFETEIKLPGFDPGIYLLDIISTRATFHRMISIE